jgi:MarR family
MLAKFYPLDRAEWLRACHELTPSERDVLYFIRTSDPYSNGIRVNSAAIARDLSTPSRQVHRQTVSRALKSLVNKGFIELEILEPTFKVLGGGKHIDLAKANVEQPEANDATACGKRVSHHTTVDLNASDVPHPPVENGCATTPIMVCDTPYAIATHQLSPETDTAQRSQESKISNTYKDKDLSEREEKFFEMKEIKNLIQSDQNLIHSDQNLTQEKPEKSPQEVDRKSPPKPKLKVSDEKAKSSASQQTAQNSLEIAKGDKDFMDWAIRRSTRLNARNAQIHATTCLKRDEALVLWQEYQRSQTRPQPLYLEFDSPAAYAAYIEKRREELLYGMAS